MPSPATPLTEAAAAVAFARAWNRLDPREFINLPHPDCCYTSQWVFDELSGRDAIAGYLTAKMKTIRSIAINAPARKVFAELGRTTQGFIGRDCAFLAQGRKENITAAALFMVGGESILRYDLCIVELLGVARSGVYPI